MEDLKACLKSDTIISNRKVNDISKIVSAAVHENSEASIDLLINHFLGNDAPTILQAFSSEVIKIVKGKNLYNLFETKSHDQLEHSFWKSEKPSFNAASNSIVIFKPQFLFTGHENDFGTFLTAHFSDQQASLSTDNFSSFGKIIESYIQLIRPAPLFDQLSQITFILFQILSQQTNFDISFTLLRSIANILSISISKEELQHLYLSDVLTTSKSISNTNNNLNNDQTHSNSNLDQNTEIQQNVDIKVNQNELFNINHIIESIKKLQNTQITLLLSLLAKNSSDPKTSAIFSLNRLGILLQDNSSIPDRVFGYTSLSQLCPCFIQKEAFDMNNFSQFLSLLIPSFLRDFDSSNNLVTFSLKGLFKSALKIAKSAGPDVVSLFSSKLLDSVSPLSWHSQVKAFLVPQILPYIDVESFSPSFFTELITDPDLESGFIIKCVRSFAKSLPVCQLLISDSIKSVQNCNYLSQLPNLRSIFSPIFEEQPKLIAPTFSKLVSPEKYQSSWLTLQGLLSTPRTKWPLSNDQVIDLISYGLSCAHWDVQVASFQAFVLANMPSSQAEIKLFKEKFENLLYFDSPYHTAAIEASLIDLVSRIASRKSQKTYNDQVSALKYALDKISEHMMTSAVSAKRQYALQLAKPIISQFPELVSPTNNLDQNQLISIPFRALISTLSDPSSSLQSSARQLLAFINSHSPIQNKNSYGNNPNNTNNNDSNNNIENSNNNNDISNNNANTNNDNSNVQNQIGISGKDSNLEFLNGLLSQFVQSEEEQWEAASDLLESIVSYLQKINGKQNKALLQEFIKNACNTIFDKLILTRKLGLTCRAQVSLETLARMLTKENIQEMISLLSEKLLNAFNGFDMENMRRSAALPYLAQSIIRIEPPEAMELPGSSFQRLSDALLRSINSPMNSTEATHSLNVIRAVLTDKTTSVVAESLLPNVLSAILNVSLQFTEWDVISAANLCLGAVMAKAFKRNTKEETKSLSLTQFLAKMTGAKEALLNNIKSGKHHPQYLALTVIASLTSSGSSISPQSENISISNDHFIQNFNDSKESENENEDLIEACIPLLNDKDSRMRRVAARSIVNCTGENVGNRVRLFQKMRETKPSSFNQAHGQAMVLRALLEKSSSPLIGALKSMKYIFRPFNVLQFPPFTWEDLLYVNRRFGIPFPMDTIPLSSFSFDESTLFVFRRKIGQNLPPSHLSALLTKLNLSHSNSITNTLPVFFSSPYEFLLPRSCQNDQTVQNTQPIQNCQNDQIIQKTQSIQNSEKVNQNSFICSQNDSYDLKVDDLVVVLKQMLETPEKLQETQRAITIGGIKYLVDNLLEEGQEIPITLLQQFLMLDLPPYLLSHVIRLIRCTHMSPADSEGVAQSLIRYVFNPDEALSEVRVAVSEISNLLQGSKSGRIVLLRLLVDDVPIVRNKTLKGVEGNVDLCINQVIEKLLNKMDSDEVKEVSLIWLEKIRERSEWDQHGEPLSTFVDEFFLVRKIFQVKNIKFDFDYFQPKNLYEVRNDFVKQVLAYYHS